MNNTSTHHALLYVGPAQETEKRCIQNLLENVCLEKGCNTCMHCRAVYQKQHPALLWIAPEKNYNREQLEPLFEAAAFVRDEEHPLFIVLSKADYMNAACANSLLKLLEEPPTGYYFMLLTESIEAILPTIRSRCVTYSVKSSCNNAEHPLLALCTTGLRSHSLMAAHDLLERENLSEHESERLFEQCIHFWISVYQKNILENNAQAAKEAHAILEIFYRQSNHPAMPGSSKLFWRAIVLSLQTTYSLNYL